MRLVLASPFLCSAILATVSSFSLAPRQSNTSPVRFNLPNSQPVTYATATTHDIQAITNILKYISRGNLDQNDRDQIEDRLVSILGHDRAKFCSLILAAPPDRVLLLIERPKLIIQHPYLAECILRSNANISTTKQWFNRYLKLTKSDAAKLQSRWPNSDDHILSLGRYRLRQWFAYFLSSEIGLNNQQLRKMVISRPILLSYKLSNMQSKTNFFYEEVGLTNSEFKSMIHSYPSVLTFSIENRLRPHIYFLQNDIGGGKDNWKAWKKVICSFPRFFSQPLDKTLPKIDFFCDDECSPLRLKRSELSQVFGKFPPTLGLTNEKLAEKLDFLREALRLDLNELKEVIVAYPQVLGLSVEKNLKPKMAFFSSASDEEAGDDNSYGSDCNCILSKEELKEFVLYQPAFLAYSLEKRLKPRIRRMEEVGISFRYCPPGIMSYTDEKFETWLSTQTASWTIAD